MKRSIFSYKSVMLSIAIIIAIFGIAEATGAATVTFSENVVVELTVDGETEQFTIVAGSEAEEVIINDAGTTITFTLAAGQDLTFKSSDKWQLINSVNYSWTCDVNQSFMIIDTPVTVTITPEKPACSGGGGGGGSNSNPIPIQSPTASPSATPVPTSTLVPTSSPTSEPEPTLEPEPVPLPTADTTDPFVPLEEKSDSESLDSNENFPTDDVDITTPQTTSIQTAIPIPVESALATEQNKAPIIPIPAVLESIVEAAQKVLIPATLVTIPIVIVSTVANAISLFATGVGVVEYLRYLIQVILILFGIKKRAIPWGTVYNARTKAPISFAKVTLLDTGNRVVDTQITDMEGRYGFVVNPEMFKASGAQFHMTVEKKDFIFPSTTDDGPELFIIYRNRYHGEIIHLKKDTPINHDIPIEPIQIETRVIASHNIPSMRLHNIFVVFANWAFWLSIIVVPLTYILNPTFFNLILLIVLLGFNVLRILGGLRERPYGMVIDKNKGFPMPYALITLNDESGQRKGFAVTNELGKYIILTDKGDFLMSVSTPADIQPPRSTQKPISTHKGWIAERVDL
jgi:hypothetical protein